MSILSPRSRNSSGKTEFMNVTIKKLTTLEEARRAIETTVGKDFASSANLNQVYTWMHSPIRTQIFDILLEDIPTFVSVHLARHVSTTPFVLSKRVDRGGDGKEDRYTPVDHRILANAEAIINMAQKRMCYKASPETREVVYAIRDEMMLIDPDLGNHMVPMCVFRGGICVQPKPCGNYKIRRYNPQEMWKELI